MASSALLNSSILIGNHLLFVVYDNMIKCINIYGIRGCSLWQTISYTSYLSFVPPVQFDSTASNVRRNELPWQRALMLHLRLARPVQHPNPSFHGKILLSGELKCMLSYAFKLLGKAGE